MCRAPKLFALINDDDRNNLIHFPHVEHEEMQWTFYLYETIKCWNELTKDERCVRCTKTNENMWKKKKKNVIVLVSRGLWLVEFHSPIHIKSCISIQMSFLWLKTVCKYVQLRWLDIKVGISEWYFEGSKQCVNISEHERE